MSKIYHYNLKECYELKGYWNFFINNEFKEIAGILKLSKDEIRLELFAPIWNFISQKDHSFDTITGKLLNGEFVTLIDSSIIYLGETTDLFASYCIIGEKFESIDSIVFDSFYICQKDLRNWIWKKTSEFEDKGDEYEYKLKTPPKDFEIKVNDNLIISNFYATRNNWNIFNEPYFEQNVCIKFNSIKTPFSYKTIIDNYIFTWNTLFSIFVGRTCNIEYIKANKGDKNCNIFYRKDHYPNRDIPAFCMFIPYSEIRNNFETIIKNWFNETKKSKKYARELFMYGFEFWGLNTITKEGYLDLFQAIEGLSKISEQEYKVDESVIIELKDVAKKFLEEKSIPTEISEEIYNKIPSLNAQHSTNILMENFMKNHIDSEIISLLKIDRKYTKEMTEIRHTLSHNKGRNYYDIVSFGKFQDMYIKLMILLMYVLCIDCGIDKEIVKSGIKDRCSWIKNFIKSISMESNNKN